MTWLRDLARSRTKELRKLRSHVTVRRALAKRLNDAGPAADPTAQCDPALQRQVRYLLQRTDWCHGNDLSAAHDYAGELEELLPYIANESYLRTVLAYELTRTNARITLTTLLPGTELDALRRLSGSGPALSDPGVPDGCGDGQRRMAECLSLLARERSGQARHDRLMGQLRQTYLLFFGVLITVLLSMIFVAIYLGVHAHLTRADIWARLLLVLSSGALGSVLAAATRLKYSLDLESFRVAARLIYIQPLVGATFGLTSWLVLTAGVVKVASSHIGWATYAAIAFASGFSEPFALGIVRRLAPGNPPAPQDRPSPP